MARDVGAPTRLLDQAEKDRLDEVRRRSSDQWRSFLDQGPDDALGALAWMVGAAGEVPTDIEAMKTRIDRARAEGFAWRQIADALGEGDSSEAGRRVMDRRRSWD